MNSLHMVLKINYHLCTLLKRTLCPDLPAAPVTVSSLDMIHQATNPDITEGTQLHPFP